MDQENMKSDFDAGLVSLLGSLVAPEFGLTTTLSDITVHAVELGWCSRAHMSLYQVFGLVLAS